MTVVGPFQLELFHSILFYSILFYSILFYSILFYSIPFYCKSMFVKAAEPKQTRKWSSDIAASGRCCTFGNLYYISHWQSVLFREFSEHPFVGL